MEKTCAQCRMKFDIGKDDLAFYDKLSPEIGGKTFAIPPPTLCPECRQRRRMSFRNERHLYRRTCDVTGQEIVSMFSQENPHKVCEKNHWYSDAFDPFAYGRPYDFGTPFFEQFRRLSFEVPLPSLRVELSENCEFNIDMLSCANCYLCSRTHYSQNLLYTYRGTRSTDCMDCLQVRECSHLYECVECVKCQDSRYLFFCIDCSSSAFLLDCRNCFDCFMCCNLRSKKYCFLNEQLTKEAYAAKLKEFNFGSQNMVALAKNMYADIRKKAIRRALMITNCEDVSGDNILESKHCHACFGVQSCQDGRYLWDVKLHRDAMDEYSGGRDSELMYETTSGSGSYDVQFCLRASDSQRIRYSFYTTASKDIFGSVGLRRAQYCILNKQYTEAEYNTLVPKIIEHMRNDGAAMNPSPSATLGTGSATGSWGEFFPGSLSPFAYNETAAQEHFPLTKAAAETLGYRWATEDMRQQGERAYPIPATIESVQDDITKHQLCCKECSKHYKVVPQELAIYRERRIPVPRNCIDCRFMARLHAKNPQTLRTMSCAKCRRETLTSFPKDCPETIYCETCYLETVY